MGYGRLLNPKRMEPAMGRHMLHAWRMERFSSMTTIPNEAIEAAAKAMWDYRPTQTRMDGTGLEWDLAHDYFKERFRADARAALEAARPAIAAHVVQNATAYTDAWLKGDATEGGHEWSVYEHAAGKVWKVDPPTHENACREAAMAGMGHEALPSTQAEAMRNAWAAGRMAGIEITRAGQPGRRMNPTNQAESETTK